MFSFRYTNTTMRCFTINEKARISAKAFGQTHTTGTATSHMGSTDILLHSMLPQEKGAKKMDISAEITDRMITEMEKGQMPSQI